MVENVGFDYNVSNCEREFKVLSAIADAADAKGGRFSVGESISFETTLSKGKCHDIILKLGLVPAKISVTRRFGMFKKEVTVKF